MSFFAGRTKQAFGVHAKGERSEWRSHLLLRGSRNACCRKDEKKRFGRAPKDTLSQQSQIRAAALFLR